MDRFDLEKVMHYIGPGGCMEKGLPGFVHRKEQVRLAEQVSRAFLDNMFLTGEVGTGVGKTFGYLIPSILWAVLEKEKVVVSTRTKALQQQLVERDLPDLQQVLEFNFHYAEAKGRENYLCWNKYLNALGGRKALEESEVEFIQSILPWAESTVTGDRKELAISGGLMTHWKAVGADRKSCLNANCRYRDKCFRLKMIRNLDKADIIVVNNSLLLADMLVDNSILPEYHYLVLDEAHTFNREAFDKLSNRFSRYETLEMYRWLYNNQGKGYLQYLKSRFPQIAAALLDLADLIGRGSELTTKYFASIQEKLKYSVDFNYTHIMENRGRDITWYNAAQTLYLDWKNNHHLMIRKLEDLKSELPQDEETEISGAIASMLEISDKIFSIMDEDIGNDQKIVWVEYEKGQPVSICSSVIDIGETIDNMLYARLKSLIMVSATLTIEDKFDHFIAKNGLTFYARQERLFTLLERSPFDYKNHACLYVLKDLPDPASEKFEEYLRLALDEIISSVGGRTLVLFTSRKQLLDTAQFLRPRCEEQRIKLLVQYEDGNFGTLINEFVSDSNTILMGVETFWEGVDLKGEILKCLVIVKLPFRSPTDPYCSAGDRYCREQRQNSFMNFTLPDATVRFKQGVGRLIRSEEDRGVVVVLDTRLINRRYGQVFMNSIPVKNVDFLTRPELKEHISKWL